MAKRSQLQCRGAGRNFCLKPGAIACMVLLYVVSFGTQAQDETDTCPCFSHEEVESIFLRALNHTTAEGESSCKSEDYSVELNAEITIWDTDYSVVAQVRVEWMDYDPGVCGYIDTLGNPGVERTERWPHPAPEATARACYNIITSVIAKSDTTGKCMTM